MSSSVIITFVDIICVATVTAFNRLASKKYLKRVNLLKLNAALQKDVLYQGLFRCQSIRKYQPVNILCE